CPVCFAVVFFSSRRRHTRSKRDWSSDVCSSDLGRRPVRGRGELAGDVAGGDHPPAQTGRGRRIGHGGGREGERRLGTASGGVGVAHGSNLSVVPTPVPPMVDPQVMWNVEGAGSMPYRDLDTSGVLVH